MVRVGGVYHLTRLRGFLTLFLPLLSIHCLVVRSDLKKVEGRVCKTLRLEAHTPGLTKRRTGTPPPRHVNRHF